MVILLAVTTGGVLGGIVGAAPATGGYAANDRAARHALHPPRQDGIRVRTLRRLVAGPDGPGSVRDRSWDLTFPPSEGAIPVPPTIVCGVDHSALSGHAAHVGRRVADALGARLLLVHATPAPAVSLTPFPLAPSRPLFAVDGVDDVVRAAAERLLGEIGDEVEVPDEDQVHAVGDPARCLTEVASETAAELIVIGTRGQGPVGVALKGSVSADVVAPAGCAILAVGPGIDAPGGAIPGRSIVCAVDGDPDGEAVRTGRHLADALGLRLILVHVLSGEIRPESLTGAGELPLDAGTSPTTARQNVVQRMSRLLREATDRHAPDDEMRVRAGSVADQIKELAREEDAAIVVVGSRGRGLLASAVLGSVSRDLVCQVNRPVVVCPHST